MKIIAKEPEFAKSTILLGSEIAQQLIESSRRSRPKWTELFQKYQNTLPDLVRISKLGKHIVHHPLVREFILEWARNISWGICSSGCVDAIGVKVPSIHLTRLADTGGVEALEFLLGDLADFCSASLGNNKHNRQFGLIINCPAWLELASRSEYQSCFERQLEMVIHHEMAHFKYQGSGIRSETHAHCRGIAAILPRDKPPKSIEEFREMIGQEYPEIVHNEEMRSLVFDQGQTTWRLVRMWLHLFQNVRVCP
jgi:hypothetical protein